MRGFLSIGLVVAVGVGITIGMNNAINGSIGKALSAPVASVIINGVAGLSAVVIALVLHSRGMIDWSAVKPMTPLILLAALTGFMILGGITFALPRVGAVAATVAFILGQTVVAVIVDTMGIGSYDPVPLDVRRILGLVLLAVATYLVLPHQPVAQ
ncbi:MAG: DMT family transporter [Anaerolineae bacterium]|nr:DMT family transporter [Anaerolineae bacterium]